MRASISRVTQAAPRSMASRDAEHTPLLSKLAPLWWVQIQRMLGSCECVITVWSLIVGVLLDLGSAIGIGYNGYMTKTKCLSRVDTGYLCEQYIERRVCACLWTFCELCVRGLRS